MEKYQINYYSKPKNKPKFKKLMIILIFLVFCGATLGYFFLKNKYQQGIQGNTKGLETQAESPNQIDPDDPNVANQNQSGDSKYAPVLLYHHIAKKTPQNSYYVSPEIFDSQMKWLQDNSYQVISLDEFFQGITGKKSLPKKPVVISFDDGYMDNYKNAFPILKKYGYTATFFVKTSTIGKGDMNWKILKELQGAGMTIASHSVDHNDLKKLKPEEVDKELTESKNILEENLGGEIKYFSYPLGTYSNQIVEEVKKAKYAAAFTVIHKVNQNIKNENDLYKLPRIHIDDEMPTFIDWIQGKNLK